MCYNDLFKMMRRCLSHLLLLTWLLLGTGAVAHLHNLQHDWEDRANKSQTPLSHNDNNCAIHAQVHAPSLKPVLDTLPERNFTLCGRLASPQQQVEHHKAVRCVDCRGPPSC